MPPIIAIAKIEFEQIPEVVGYEETANLGTIPPLARMLVELNCPAAMVRRLSTSVWLDGKEAKPDLSEWQYVPPETNDANLLQLACSNAAFNEMIKRGQ